MTLLATDPKRRWIDNVALHSDGTLAWSVGKTAFVRGRNAEDKSFEVPSTVGGLAFAPKGLRLAIAHYNGVTLWFPNMAVDVEFLEWAGSHLDVVFSPDNRFLVTAMHEPALHGWRLADNKHMRMVGLPGRVRSMSWSANGKALATSGADTVILWPFASKDGPMGKEPTMLAPLPTKVARVACNPKQDILAAAYIGGTILLVRLSDGAEILVKSATAGSRHSPGMPMERNWHSPPRMARRACLLDCNRCIGPVFSGVPGGTLPAAAVDPELNRRVQRHVSRREQARLSAGFHTRRRPGCGRASSCPVFRWPGSPIIRGNLPKPPNRCRERPHRSTRTRRPRNQNPGGERPTTPAPQPARPDAQAQQEGVQPALPPAPAEKTAPPIKER